MLPMDELEYVVYARRFGWTPEQVDKLPLHLEPWFLPIDDAIEADISKRMEAAYKAKHVKK
jgi:hypothetical protein